MDALECRGDTALPTAILLLSGVLALPTALLGIAAGQPKSLLTLIAPLAAAVSAARTGKVKAVPCRQPRAVVPVFAAAARLNGWHHSCTSPA